VGERTLLPATLPLSPPNVVDGTFGRGVFDRLADLESERWTGPITSAFGSHLVKVVEREPASVRPFEAVRAEVEADWREVRAQAMRERQFERLRARYTVVRAPESAP
jgi:parvulin-like peptidyl-prolyl isomerase